MPALQSSRSRLVMATMLVAGVPTSSLPLCCSLLLSSACTSSTSHLRTPWACHTNKCYVSLITSVFSYSLQAPSRSSSASSTHPSHVIAPLVVGCALLVAFALWETYGNTKHPLTPTEIFTNGWGRDFTAPCIALAVINMFYYSSSILWPTMISVFYTKPEDGWQRGAILSLPQGLAITAGGVLLSLFGSKIRHWQHQQTVAVTIMVFFGSLMALARPDNMGMMIAFMTLSLMGYGWSIYLCIAVTQMGVPHEKLGTSGGLSGCARFAGGSSE
jgi:hypothetical protein